MAVVTFKINIIGWEKHQQNKKKNHRYFLLENRFFQDDKIASLSAVETRLYLYLLTVAADLNQSSYSLNTNLIPTYFRLRTSSIHDALTKFELLQLLSYEKTASNTIQNNTKQKNRKENNKIKIENLPTQSANAVDVVVVPKFKLKLSSTKEIELKQDLVNSWQDTYPKEFLDLSLKEMRNWLLANEAKAPKSQWPRFINGWFKRGWERHRLTIKSQPAKMTLEDFEEIMRGGL